MSINELDQEVTVLSSLLDEVADVDITPNAQGSLPGDLKVLEGDGRGADFRGTLWHRRGIGSAGLFYTRCLLQNLGSGYSPQVETTRYTCPHFALYVSSLITSNKTSSTMATNAV